MDRKDLTGHKNGDISRLYCAPVIEHLRTELEKLVTVGADPVLKVIGKDCGRSTRRFESPTNLPQDHRILFASTEVTT